MFLPPSSSSNYSQESHQIRSNSDDKRGQSRQAKNRNYPSSSQHPENHFPGNPGSRKKANQYLFEVEDNPWNRRLSTIAPSGDDSSDDDFFSDDDDSKHLESGLPSSGNPSHLTSRESRPETPTTWPDGSKPAFFDELEDTLRNNQSSQYASSSQAAQSQPRTPENFQRLQSTPSDPATVSAEREIVPPRVTSAATQNNLLVQRGSESRQVAQYIPAAPATSGGPVTLSTEVGIAPSQVLSTAAQKIQDEINKKMSHIVDIQKSVKMEIDESEKDLNESKLHLASAILDEILPKINKLEKEIKKIKNDTTSVGKKFLSVFRVNINSNENKIKEMKDLENQMEKLVSSAQIISSREAGERELKEALRIAFPDSPEDHIAKDASDLAAINTQGKQIVKAEQPALPEAQIAVETASTSLQITLLGEDGSSDLLGSQSGTPSAQVIVRGQGQNKLKPSTSSRGLNFFGKKTNK